MNCFAQALDIAIGIQGIISLVFSLPGIALLLADEGQIEQAIEIYATISQMDLVANSLMQRDLAGRELQQY